MKPGKHHNLGAGFTLVEVFIAMGIFSLIVIGTLTVYLMCQRIWRSSSVSTQATLDSNLAIARLVYGPGRNNGLRSASQNQLQITEDSSGSWTLVYSNRPDGVLKFSYDSEAGNILFGPDTAQTSNMELVCNNVVFSSVAQTNEGIAISLSIARADGRFTATNHASTFVKLRNK